MPFFKRWGLTRPPHLFISLLLELHHLLSGTDVGEVICLKTESKFEWDWVWEEGDRIRYEKDRSHGFSKQLVLR